MNAQRLRALTADWVLPVTSPPIREGSVVLGRESIRFVGSSLEAGERFPEAERIALPGRIILPGLVNAHCHLDNCFLQNKLPLSPKGGFVDWLRRLIALQEGISAEEKKKMAASGLAQIRESGTAALADITHDPYTLALLEQTEIEAVCFHEIVGFLPAEADAIYREGRTLVAGIQGASPFQHLLAPHSPYSVSRELLERIALGQPRVTFHLAESREEVEFLRQGHPAMEGILKSLGKWDPRWTPPGISPVRYFDEIGLLHPRAIAVHMVWVKEEDYPVLERTRPSICLCIRSNDRLHNGRPPVRDYLKIGMNLCLGTDGLGSNEDLSVLNEMRYVKKRFPGLRDEKILEMGTLGGAKALGLAQRFGSLEPGKSAQIAIIDRGSDKGPYAFLQEEN